MNIIILLWDQKINTNTYNNNNSSNDDSDNDNIDNNNNSNNKNNNDNNNENEECWYVDWNITKIKIKVVFELIAYGVVVSRYWQWSNSMIWFVY